MERGRDEFLRQYTRRLAQIEAASAAALVTMPTATWGTVLKKARGCQSSQIRTSTHFWNARAINMLDVGALEGIIKAAVKQVVYSFMATGGDQHCNDENKETEELSGEDESCPFLDEMMTASWIAREEGLSETEATDSSFAMNEQRKRTWAQAQDLKKATRKERGFFFSRRAGRNRADGSRPPRQHPRQPSNSTDGDGMPKDLRARLRRENKCFRCKKKGRWKAECQEKQPSKDGTDPAALPGLTHLHTVEGV